ncbi:hypothetical protein BDV06DRAFT_48546 [Aspergillus oleicola]
MSLPVTIPIPNTCCTCWLLWLLPRLEARQSLNAQCTEIMPLVLQCIIASPAPPIRSPTQALDCNCHLYPVVP